MSKVRILETTLRDGSYAIDFKFTANDTAIIAKMLEAAGLELIEVGHGVGLNASAMGYGEAVQTDEEYMVAAQEALTTAKWGMFCIPGIARLSDVDLAATHHMGFIRVGTNVTEVDTARDFIERARGHGMFVTANFMKSYAMEPAEFAQTVKLAQDYGAQLVYIVDSAGGMFADTVRAYYEAVREVTDVPLGFHGHNNLALAVSNTLEAVKLGIQYVDSSLQGLGRSSGNAPTEILVAALDKLGYETGVDLEKVLDIGLEYVQPLITAKGVAPLDVVAGYSEFHSSYMHHIEHYSAKHRVHPAQLIMAITKIDRVHVDEAVLDEVAASLPRREDLYLGKYGFSRYFGREQDED